MSQYSYFCTDQQPTAVVGSGVINVVDRRRRQNPHRYHLDRDTENGSPSSSDHHHRRHGPSECDQPFRGALDSDDGKHQILVTARSNNLVVSRVDNTTGTLHGERKFPINATILAIWSFKPPRATLERREAAKQAATKPLGSLATVSVTGASDSHVEEGLLLLTDRKELLLLSYDDEDEEERSGSDRHVSKRDDLANVGNSRKSSHQANNRRGGWGTLSKVDLQDTAGTALEGSPRLAVDPTFRFLCVSLYAGRVAVVRIHEEDPFRLFGPWNFRTSGRTILDMTFLYESNDSIDEAELSTAAASILSKNNRRRHRFTGHTAGAADSPASPNESSKHRRRGMPEDDVLPQPTASDDAGVDTAETAETHTGGINDGGANTGDNPRRVTLSSSQQAAPVLAVLCEENVGANQRRFVDCLLLHTRLTDAEDGAAPWMLYPMPVGGDVHCLLPVVQPLGGLVILGTRTLLYMNSRNRGQKLTEHHHPASINYTIANTTELWNGDRNDSFKWLLTDTRGNLLILTMTADGGGRSSIAREVGVTSSSSSSSSSRSMTPSKIARPLTPTVSFQLERIARFSGPSSCLSILAGSDFKKSRNEEGITLFLGSRLCDSFNLRIVHPAIGGIGCRTDMTSGKTMRVGGKKKVSIVQRFRNLAPLLDAAIVEGTESGRSELFALGGFGDSGKLCVVRSGVSMRQTGSSPSWKCPSGARQIWTLKRDWRDNEHSHVVVEFLSRTCVFEIVPRATTTTTMMRTTSTTKTVTHNGEASTDVDLNANAVDTMNGTIDGNGNDVTDNNTERDMPGDPSKDILSRENLAANGDGGGDENAFDFKLIYREDLSNTFDGSMASQLSGVDSNNDGDSSSSPSHVVHHSSSITIYNLAAMHAGNRIIQVTNKEIRVIQAGTLELITTWRPPLSPHGDSCQSGNTIFHASAHAGLLLLALGGGRILLCEFVDVADTADAKLINILAEDVVDGEIAAIHLTEHFAAIGMWRSSIIQLRASKGCQRLFRKALEGERSVGTHPVDHPDNGSDARMIDAAVASDGGVQPLQLLKVDTLPSNDACGAPLPTSVFVYETSPHGDGMERYLLIGLSTGALITQKVDILFESSIGNGVSSTSTDASMECDENGLHVSLRQQPSGGSSAKAPVEGVVQRDLVEGKSAEEKLGTTTAAPIVVMVEGRRARIEFSGQRKVPLHVGPVRLLPFVKPRESDSANELLAGCGASGDLGVKNVNDGGPEDPRSSTSSSLTADDARYPKKQCDLVVVATGERPMLIHTAGTGLKKLVFSSLNVPTSSLDCIAQFGVGGTYRQSQQAPRTMAGRKRVRSATAGRSDEQRALALWLSDQEIHVGQMDEIQKLHVETFHLGLSPDKIAYHKSSGLAVVGLFREPHQSAAGDEDAYSLIDKPDAGTLLRDRGRYDDVADGYRHAMVVGIDVVQRKVVARLHLKAKEQISCIETVYLPGAPKGLVVVGTTFVLPDEEQPSKGNVRLLQIVQRLNNWTFEELCCEPVNGAPYCATTVGAKIVLGINNRLRVYGVEHRPMGATKDSSAEKSIATELPSSSSSSPTTFGRRDGQAEQWNLKLLASHAAHTLVFTLDSWGDTILVGDLQRSAGICRFREGDGLLEEVARDFSNVWVMSASCMSSDQFLIADDSGNLIVLSSKDSLKAANDEQRCQLSTTGLFHTGQTINRLLAGFKVRSSYGPGDSRKSCESAKSLREKPEKSLREPQSSSASQKWFAKTLFTDAYAAKQPSGGSAASSSAPSAAALLEKRGKGSGEEANALDYEWKETSPSQCTIWISAEGGIGRVLSLREETQFARLRSIQESLARCDRGTGSLLHEQWRSFHTDPHTCESRNFVDGDFIDSFTDLSRVEQDDIFGSLTPFALESSGGTLNSLLHEIEHLQRAFP